jgi:ribosomal protein L11 methylase PrmA
MSEKAASNLVAGLESAMRGLHWEAAGTEWAEYTEGDSYSAAALEHKRRVVERLLSQLSPGCVWDLGANTGEFSRIACGLGARTISLDVDPACVERSYLSVRASGETRLLPLIMDLRNPSPALGWAHRERASLLDRRSADVLMALALVHHLAIANNVPLERVARFFASLAADLIVEFVPKSDPKVQTLLANRDDVFPRYTRDGFESAFAERFEILEATPIEDSERILYRMRRRS